MPAKKNKDEKAAGAAAAADVTLEEGPPAEAEALVIAPPLKRDKYKGSKDAEGNPHGRGIMRLGNGDFYDGEFVAGEMHGNGTHKWPSGAKYEGQWSEGVREGQGKYAFTPRGLTTYEGEFRGNRREGTGIYRWSNGEQYEGSFLNDQRHGKGSFKWSSLREDVCTFEEGRQVGEGVRFSADKQKAWLIQDGQEVREIPVAEAQERAEKLGEEPAEVES